MRLGLDVSQHQLSWDELVERVQLAESSGFEGAWVFDHFKAMYGDPRGPCFESWTTMAALAAVTKTIRIGALVTGVTYRHPSILATEAVTIDHISNGRLEIGIGAAWFQGEHDELGIEFPSTSERARRLEEGVQVMKLLMTDDDVSFEGRHYQLRNASYNPRPVQSPHPPIWIGATGEQLMLPIVGRWADAWHSFGPPDSLREKSAIVDRAAEEAGRDPSSIVRSTALSLSDPWDQVKRRVDDLREVGISYLTVSWPSEGRERLEQFISDVMPEISS